MKKGPTPPRKWQHMQRAVAFRTAEKQAKLEAALGHAVPEPSVEIWMNDRYVVSVDRRDDGSVLALSIRRQDRAYPRDWRHFQSIKNDIAGPEIEAVELYPAESRLMDTANQFWLWCLPSDTRFPIGFSDGRIIADAVTADEIGGVQRDFDEEVAVD
jgi:hypothetical protein